jgi:hypothetical protein
MHILRNTVVWQAAALVCLLPVGEVAAQQKRPVVVELFTSQGCSSCPPANANLIEIGKRSDVLALSFAVTYWDYLGWKDSFGKPEFTKRQYVYEPALGERGPFTPQMVIDGKASTVGYQMPEIESMIAAANTDGGPSIDLHPGNVSIGKVAGNAGKADVWLVRYDPDIVVVPVARGENRGARLPHSHVVHSLQRLGSWKGGAITLKFALAESGLRTAVLVQRPNGGEILSAATD